jgi:xanthine dehydrogenase YagS FAD-binding subunit
MSMSTMKPFEWANATSVEQALALLDKGSSLKAGGVDLVDLMKEQIASPKRVVNIRAIKELDYVKLDDADGSLRLGPLVTLGRLADEPLVRQRFTALADAAGHAATPQIRNMATLGGNLLQRPRCWYFRNHMFPCRKKGGEICYAQEGENQYHAIFNNQLCAIVHPSATACALVAMGATLQLTNAKDKRDVKAAEFFLLPNVDLHRENQLRDDEMITEVRVPSLPASAKSAYIKQGEKESFDWPVSECAVVLDRDGDRCKSASIVLGAASPVPHRAKEAEAALVGQTITVDTARAAAKAAMEAARPLANNRYKVALFQTIITRTILMATGMNGHENGGGR